MQKKKVNSLSIKTNTKRGQKTYDQLSEVLKIYKCNDFKEVLSFVPANRCIKI